MKVSTAPTTFTEVAHWHGTSEEAASEVKGRFLICGLIHPISLPNNWTTYPKDLRVFSVY